MKYVHTFSICTSQYTICQEICSHYLYDLLYSNKWLKNIHFTVSRLVTFSFNKQKALIQPAPDWSRINRSLSQPLKKSCYQLYFITLLMVNTEGRIFHPQPFIQSILYQGWPEITWWLEKIPFIVLLLSWINLFD